MIDKNDVVLDLEELLEDADGEQELIPYLIRVSLVEMGYDVHIDLDNITNEELHVEYDGQLMPIDYYLSVDRDKFQVVVKNINRYKPKYFYISTPTNRNDSFYRLTKYYNENGDALVPV